MSEARELLEQVEEVFEVAEVDEDYEPEVDEKTITVIRGGKKVKKVLKRRTAAQKASDRKRAMKMKGKRRGKMSAATKAKMRKSQKLAQRLR